MKVSDATEIKNRLVRDETFCLHLETAVEKRRAKKGTGRGLCEVLLMKCHFRN